MAFIVVLTEKDRDALAAIRLFPNIEVATFMAQIWLRIPLSNEGLATEIRQLPLVETYLLDENELLYPLGGVTPVGKLMPMSWMSLPLFMPIELPVSVMPAEVSETVNTQIVASAKEQKAMALCTTSTEWLAYVITAPEVRLKRLKFAVSDANNVLIVGEPLPPIEGETYWLSNNIFMPSGYDFELPIVSELIYQKENLQNQAFLCFNTEGSHHRIEELDFVLATRSAVRLTFQE
jgi:MoxR-vWA-beta-propeller ternary system domain bpX2